MFLYYNFDFEFWYLVFLFSKKTDTLKQTKFPVAYDTHKLKIHVIYLFMYVWFRPIAVYAKWNEASEGFSHWSQHWEIEGSTSQKRSSKWCRNPSLPRQFWHGSEGVPNTCVLYSWDVRNSFLFSLFFNFQDSIVNITCF